MNLLNKTKKFYYFLRNPIYKLYCFVFRPKSFGVKVVVENNNNKILMVKIGYAHKKWTFPGGGVKKNESFEKAAVRELEEEVGIKTSNLLEIGEYSSGSNFKKNTVKCFYFQTDSILIKIDNFEIIDSGWYELSQIPEDCSFAVEKILRIYKKFKKIK